MIGFNHKTECRFVEVSRVTKLGLGDGCRGTSWNVPIPVSIDPDEEITIFYFGQAANKGFHRLRTKSFHAPDLLVEPFKRVENGL